MDEAKSRPGLKKQFQKLSAEVQGFFSDFIGLLDAGFGFDVILAYIFFRIERGQTQTLYCGARKIHKTDSDLTWRALNIQHITRDKYRQLFQNIYGFEIDQHIQKDIEDAEEIRDRLMHGKDVDEPSMRNAVSKALLYAEGINDLIANKKHIGFKPYHPDLRGVFGRLESQDNTTSKWILKGMGFELK